MSGVRQKLSKGYLSTELSHCQVGKQRQRIIACDVLGLYAFYLPWGIHSQINVFSLPLIKVAFILWIDSFLVSGVVLPTTGS